MTTITYTDYQKARQAGYDGTPGMPMPASSALALARFHAEPVDWHGLEPTGHTPGDREPVAKGIVDGFTITVTLEDEMERPDATLGEFAPARDRYGDRVPRPDPSAILWTNRGNWGLERGWHWYTPTESLEELARYYAGKGAARGVARELALADVKRRAEQDAKNIEDGEYVVMVEASRGGIELGRDSIGGMGLSDDWERDLAGSGYLEDMIEQAIEEAQAALAALGTEDA